MALADLPQVAARSRVYIGGEIDLTRLPSELDPAAFADQTWTEIERLEFLDQLGDRAEAGEHGSSRRGPPDLHHFYRKSRTALTWAPRFTATPGLPGQSELLAAHEDGGAYAFRIDLGPPQADASRARRLFVGVVGSVTEILGAPNDLPIFQPQIWRCTPVLRFVTTAEI